MFRPFFFFLAVLAMSVVSLLPVWAEDDCTWSQANYDATGWLQSVRIQRGGSEIATINHVKHMDFYWVQCNGISKKEAFNTANDAAWAACLRCR